VLDKRCSLILIVGKTEKQKDRIYLVFSVKDNSIL